MNRLNFTLFIVVMVLAVSVVHAQHKARNLFMDLQKEKDLTDQRSVEWKELQLEQGTLASAGRVEAGALNTLHMHLPASDDTRVVVLFRP